MATDEDFRGFFAQHYERLCRLGFLLTGDPVQARAPRGRDRAVGCPTRRLPLRQRAVLVLRYYEDLSEAEIARVLGIPAGTVKTLARRGLARLRRSLDATTQGHTLSVKERP
jgi:DNA-binding CsgD family transcriptional regulator